MNAAIQEIGGECGSVMMVDEGSNELFIKASRGMEDKIVRDTRIPIGVGISGIVAKIKQPIILSKSRPVPPFIVLGSLARPDIYSSIIAPLSSGDKVFGTININSKSPNDEFTEESIRSIMKLSEKTVSVIEKLSRLEKFDTEIKQMTSFLDIIRRLNSSRDIESLKATLSYISDLIMDITGASSSAFVSTTKLEDNLDFLNVKNLSEQFLSEGIEWDLNYGIGGMTCREESIKYFDDLSKYEMIHSPYFKNEGIISLVSIPIKVDNYVAAIYYFMHNAPLNFTKEKLDYLKNLGHEIGVTFSNVKEHYELKQLAFVDNVTRVFNRNYWTQRLLEEIKRSDRSHNPLTLVIFDIDNFKKCNDQFGHIAGDEVLRRVAAIIKENSREVDYVGRYGGEEFGLILPNLTEDVAFKVTERIREQVESSEFIRREYQKISVTLSAGIAVYPQDAKTDRDLIDSADKAMYLSKKRGKNRTSIFREFAMT
ncbi:sensor domain-containing diguanylate cyclase [bacterium]|nr:sensor domain-containing diguanylate cyclase [bacterium]